MFVHDVWWWAGLCSVLPVAEEAAWSCLYRLAAPSLCDAHCTGPLCASKQQAKVMTYIYTV